jgi:hypothetical protein
MSINTNNISQKAVLVSMRISRMGTSKVDRDMSNELTDVHQMERGSARVSKVLVQNKYFKKVNRICNEAKAVRDKFTLPWNDQGQRMLPSSVFRKFDTEMTRIKNDFEVAVNELESEYPDIIEDAKRRLNGKFKQEDYPDSIKDKYDFDLEIVPMPKGSDFRLDVVTDEEKEKLTQEIEKRTEDRIRKSTSDVVHRMMESITVLLQGTDGKSGLLNPDARFHKTAVSKLQEILDVAPSLNVLDDPKLNAVIDTVKNLIKPENLDVNSIRKDKKVRQQVLSDSLEAVESINVAMSGIV